MDIWSQVAAIADALILRDPMDIAAALLALLAAPLLTFWTRSVALASVAIVLTALPLWMVISSLQATAAALWFAGTWLALNLIQIAAVMHERNILMSQDLMERLTEMDYRIDTFLDALDRRAALGSDDADLRIPSRVRDGQVRGIHESAS